MSYTDQKQDDRRNMAEHFRNVSRYWAWRLKVDAIRGNDWTLSPLIFVWVAS